jgi:hypothetical protein
MSHSSDPGKPTPCKTNPGRGSEVNIAFTNGQRNWTETVNLVTVAAQVMTQHQHTVAAHQDWLEHPDSGFALLPQLVDMQPLDDGGARTVTTIQIHHPILAPEGVFEYQHSAGDNVEQAVARGFDQWVQVDFVPLLEALRPKPSTCTALEMSFPAKDGKPERWRRAVLGPVMHYMAKPPKTQPEEEHPFCPCCLLTRSFMAFKEMMEGEAFFCLRLFASRDERGVPQADCRVNGDDWTQGAEALCAYAATWPPAGYEFRKQYVVLQTIDRSMAHAVDAARPEEHA